MNDKDYSELLRWAKERGLRLNGNIERKCVNGLWGMYAKSDIPKGTKLVQLPKSMKLPLLKNFDYPDQLFANGDFIGKSLHASLREYVSGESSDYYYFFKSLDSNEALRQNSVYFFTDDQLDIVKGMNLQLYASIRDFNARCDFFISRLCKIEPDVDKDDITTTVLNYVRRAWNNIGFVPVVDLFNHSDVVGEPENSCKKELFFTAGKSYKSGEQIWFSYGKKDMYDHALDYGYFDPEGTHYINFPKRVIQAAKTPFHVALVKYAATKHRIRAASSNGVIQYSLAEQAFLNETAPDSKIIEYVKDTCFQTEQELKAGKCMPSSFEKRMFQILDGLLSVNKVDTYALKDLPESLHYMYHLLKKEKQMLLHNKVWTKSFSNLA